MKILYYNASDLDDHGQLLQPHFPDAEIRLWRPGDQAPADYAVVWRAPAEMWAGRTGLKAICSLGAGVDALLQFQEQLPPFVPLIRLEDAGMGEQMADYVSYAVLRYYRRFDQYQRQAGAALWQPLRPVSKATFTVAVLGLGVLGATVARRLQALTFPVGGWSRDGRFRSAARRRPPMSSKWLVRRAERSGG